MKAVITPPVLIWTKVAFARPLLSNANLAADRCLYACGSAVGRCTASNFETGLKNARQIQADIDREKGNERGKISGRIMAQKIGQAVPAETPGTCTRGAADGTFLGNRLTLAERTQGGV
jgi:hypothetical protein